ncbi:tetratricopeptide repeat protein [Pseudohongiella spirulinae]|uniref:Uncharacterized protein n=1 Tax=Pseudohongiella spirulinae TaxID=1249552 RepID=A0A0S2KB46_9GAMM|nr:tetratricopeptide repeat protein [Pseudohongiella spirulinae]ALO45537.1 hypothetical protein PS2015_865 [Pseudohongiella spirulinae]
MKTATRRPFTLNALKPIALAIVLNTAFPALANDDDTTVIARLAEFDSLLQQNQGQQALNLFNQLQQRFPDNVLVQVTQARIMLMQNNVQGGVNLLRTILREHPDHPEASLWLGDVEIKTGEREAGLNRITQASDANPSHPRLAEFAAELMYNASQLERSADYFYRAAQADGQTEARRAELLFNAGRVYVQLQQPENAIPRFNQSWRSQFTPQAFNAEMEQRLQMGEPEAGLREIQALRNIQRPENLENFERIVAPASQMLQRAFAGEPIVPAAIANPSDPAVLQQLQANLETLKTRLAALNSQQLQRTEEIAGLAGNQVTAFKYPLFIRDAADAGERAKAQAALILAKAGQLDSAVSTAESILLPELKYATYAQLTRHIFEHGGRERYQAWKNYLDDQRRYLPNPYPYDDSTLSDSFFGIPGLDNIDDNEIPRSFWTNDVSDVMATVLLDTEDFQTFSTFVETSSAWGAFVPNWQARVDSLMLDHAERIGSSANITGNRLTGYDFQDVVRLAQLLIAEGRTQNAANLINTVITDVAAEDYIGANQTDRLNIDQEVTGVIDVLVVAGELALASGHLDRVSHIVGAHQQAENSGLYRARYAELLTAVGRKTDAEQLRGQLTGSDLEQLELGISIGELRHLVAQNQLDAALEMAMSDSFVGEHILHSRSLYDALIQNGRFNDARRLVVKAGNLAENNTPDLAAGLWIDLMQKQLDAARDSVLAAMFLAPISLVERYDGVESEKGRIRTQYLYHLATIAGQFGDDSTLDRVRQLARDDLDQIYVTLGEAGGRLQALDMQVRTNDFLPMSAILKTNLVM